MADATAAEGEALPTNTPEYGCFTNLAEQQAATSGETAPAPVKGKTAPTPETPTPETIEE
jgi:hypothetical protein